MTNARFRELAPGTVAETIATLVELRYTARGLNDAPEQLVAVWWGREHLQVGDAYVPLEGGRRMESRLSDHATTVRTIFDPVLQQEVTLSAAGWVTWGMDFYDYDYNRQFPVAPPEPAPEEEEPE